MDRDEKLTTRPSVLLRMSDELRLEGQGYFEDKYQASCNSQVRCPLDDTLYNPERTE